jgi:hypothetical protein
MKVEIHHENYDAYCERQAILDTQREILHKLSGNQATLTPPTPPPIAYNKWHTDSYDWGAMERSLFVGCTTRVDDEDEEEEDEQEEEEDVDEEDGDEEDEEEEDEEEAEDDFEEDEDDDDFV